MKLIIFSKNRSSQLFTLITSIKDNSTLFKDILVLYKSTDDEYKKGYDKVRELYPEVYFHEETDFKKDLEDLLNYKKEETEYISFMVDDQIMYQKLENEDKILELITDDVLCFSLRLGMNINYRHLTNSYFGLPVYEDKGNGFVKWNWRKEGSQSDHGYPLSVDSTIYRHYEISKLISSINYNNPNTLEGNLQSKLNGLRENMLSYRYSKVVNLPINRVNDVFSNRFGDKVNINEKTLNDKFLNGEIIDYKSMDYQSVNSCHVELDLKFKEMNQDSKPYVVGFDNGVNINDITK